MWWDQDGFKRKNYHPYKCRTIFTSIGPGDWLTYPFSKSKSSQSVARVKQYFRDNLADGRKIEIIEVEQ